MERVKKTKERNKKEEKKKIIIVVRRILSITRLKGSRHVNCLIWLTSLSLHVGYTS